MRVHVEFDLDLFAAFGLLFALTVITLLARQIVREFRAMRVKD